MRGGIHGDVRTAKGCEEFRVLSRPASESEHPFASERVGTEHGPQEPIPLVLRSIEGIAKFHIPLINCRPPLIHWLTNRERAISILRHQS